MKQSAPRKPRIAVVTRTKDREITLRRTAQSVADQTCRDIAWVIVNDGGARAHVDRIAEQVRSTGLPVTVLHHDRSKGRPAAANAGIAACDCPLVVLLDDDDTHDPKFAERCIAYLDHAEFPCEGVAVWTDIIRERIVDDTITFLERVPGYCPTEITFLSLFYTNCFPPASFVFTRRAWENVGGFDERLHCSEDWFFNQNVIKFGRIGIVPEVLACLHHRVEQRDPRSAYSNTMITGMDDHGRYRDFWRDELIREDIVQGRLGLGELNILAHLHLRSEQTAMGVQRLEVRGEQIAMGVHRLEGRVEQTAISVQRLETELAAWRAAGRVINGSTRRAFAAYRALRSFVRRHVNEPLKTLGIPHAESGRNREPDSETARPPFECAVCGAEFEAFVPLPDMYVQYTEAGGRFTCADLEMLAVATHHCPICYSADRDRLAALFFRAEPAPGDGTVRSVIEFAPYPAFSAFLKSQPGVRHETCDLFMEGVDYKGDITSLDAIHDGAFDYVVCSHVLEHVGDDRAAMKELHRILVPGGRAVIIVPIYRPLDDCYEDPSIIDPVERLKHFGQPDHVRLYSRNCLVERLQDAGFEVREYGIGRVDRDLFVRNGLTETATLYIAVKSAATQDPETSFA